ncbi:MAG: hypothetical protein H0Z37_09830 [Firmicutes bacterium]|nr:hypothetical protein [Bacillota bacterium]
MWDLYRRAERYGQALSVIEDYLGSETRERVMQRFQQLAGPLQRHGWRDPWEMIAYSLQAAGVDRDTIRALFIAYLMRVDELDRASDLAREPAAVIERLRQWGLLGGPAFGRPQA